MHNEKKTAEKTIIMNRRMILSRHKFKLKKELNESRIKS
jgi:hypothetical protein